MATPQSTTASETVEYREIPELPGYRFGSDGTVWSRWVVGGVPGKRGISIRIEGDWKLKALRKDRINRLRVSLHGNKTYLVSALILWAFVGPRPNGLMCCHNDGNPMNNRPSNLRWATAKDNHNDMVRHGTITRGESSPHAKLTEAAVREIRSEHDAGRATPTQLAHRYGVTLSTICFVIKRQRWAHVA